MSDTGKEASEDVEYVRAELESLDEELGNSSGGEDLPPARRRFVELRVARLRKELPKLLDREKRLMEHEQWLAKMGQTK